MRGSAFIALMMGLLRILYFASRADIVCGAGLPETARYHGCSRKGWRR